MMQTTTPPKQDGQAHSTVQAFERGRRLAAIRAIALTFGALLSVLTVAFIGFVIVGSTVTFANPFVSITLLILLGCIMLYGWGAECARRDRLQEGVLSTLIGAQLSIVLMTLFWKLLLAHTLSSVVIALLAACTVGIVLAGALGETWMIYGTTLIMNGLALFTIGVHPLTQSDLWLTLAITLAIQWAIAVITLATARNYRSTLDELGTAYVQVQGLDALKDQFITNINHELRTPIMALHGYIEFLQNAHRDMAPAEQEEVIMRAGRAGDNLVRLLSSILDNRRMDQGAENFLPVPVPLLETLTATLSLLDAHETRMSTHELQIRIPKSWAILGEKVRLQQIYLNLLSNAIKYSPENTPIEISARLLPPKPERTRGLGGTRELMAAAIEISVRDYGLGIPPESIPLLFNRFARLPRDLASTIVGNGLGLHLCRVLARAMGGDITVESTGIEGEGSTFRVVLPMAMDLPAGSDLMTDPRLQVIVLGER